jgi:hypothetical protein
MLTARLRKVAITGGRCRCGSGSGLQ